MNWNGIVIHKSASPDVSAKVIDKWHVERGFNEIGYHFVIRQNGDIEPGRSLDVPGAHAKTGAPQSRNTSHIGICCPGDFDKKPPTIEQINSLVKLCKGLMEHFRIGVRNIEKHHNTCPGKLFPWEYFIEGLKH
ncbi:MAG: N-acetylmuramoyl-L-alanine amidase [Halanaerobiales bacterium]